MNKYFNYKIVYNLQMNNQKSKKRMITKILKFDENNQCDNGMTKPLLTGCMKIVTIFPGLPKMNKKYLSLNFLQVVLIKNLILLPTVKGFQLKIKNLLIFCNGICVSKY